MAVTEHGAGTGTRMRVSREGAFTTVKALIRHPMETGRRVDDAGRTVPAHYIRELQCTLNGVTVVRSFWGTGVAKNPFISFVLRDAEPGDEVRLQWSDNRGQYGEAVASVP